MDGAKKFCAIAEDGICMIAEKSLVRLLWMGCVRLPKRGFAQLKKAPAVQQCRAGGHLQNLNSIFKVKKRFRMKLEKRRGYRRKR